MPLALPAVLLNSSISFLMIGPPTGSPPGPQKSMATGAFADEITAPSAPGMASAAAPAAVALRNVCRLNRVCVVIVANLPHQGRINCASPCDYPSIKNSSSLHTSPQE